MLDVIRERAGELRVAWNSARRTIEQNPAAYQPHLVGASLVQLDEVVETVVNWMERVRSPSGLSPGFHLARALASTSIAGAISAASGIRRGEYAQVGALILALNQTVSALHTMFIFTSSEEKDAVLASLMASHAEGVALLATGRTELSEKIAELDTARELFALLQEASANAEAQQEVIESAASAVDASANEALEASETAKRASLAAQANRDELADALAESRSLQADLKSQKELLEELQKSSQAQSKLITALLPKGASAGLASSFAQRVKALQHTRLAWASAFALALLVLALLGYRIHGDLDSLTFAELGTFLLKRLPVAGPLIWFAWFSAIQYGNTLRLEEDYAFKEASSKAFEGYREHMEHLATVNLAEGNTAMTLLAARTVEVLSSDPLRVFGRTEVDASPTASALGRILAAKGKMQ